MIFLNIYKFCINEQKQATFLVEYNERWRQQNGQPMLAYMSIKTEHY